MGHEFLTVDATVSRSHTHFPDAHVLSFCDKNQLFDATGRNVAKWRAFVARAAIDIRLFELPRLENLRSAQTMGRRSAVQILEAAPFSHFGRLFKSD